MINLDFRHTFAFWYRFLTLIFDNIEKCILISSMRNVEMIAKKARLCTVIGLGIGDGLKQMLPRNGALSELLD